MSSPEASQSPSQEPASAPGGDQAAETRPPPPPPPPSAPAVPSLEGAWAPYADAPAPAIDLTPRPADITIVRTAEELQEEPFNTPRILIFGVATSIRRGALDIEIRAHIDTRSLNFTAFTYDRRGPPVDCGIGYGTTVAGCAFMMYMQDTRSLRGNCDGPPSDREASRMNLPDSAVESLREVKGGQCIVLLDKAAFLNMSFNKWYDNLQFAFVSDTVAAGIAPAMTNVQVDINLLGQYVYPSMGPNVFFTNVTFRALGGFRSGQALSLPNWDPLYDFEQFGAMSMARSYAANAMHSVLFRDCEFVGFEGDNPPLLVTSESFASLSNCTFRDMDLTVEIFDVSFGGSVHLEDCIFQNVQLSRNPPKFVSTSLNDEFACEEPYEQFFKYQPEDDDDYDIIPVPIDPNDASKGLYVDSATISDCLRPLNFCQQFLNLTGPAPGCPEKSVQKRRWVNHNSCGSTVDQENPEYYGTPEIPVYEPSVYEPAPPPYSYDEYEFCNDYDPVHNPFRPATFDTGTEYLQYGFISENHPWFSEVKKLLPKYESAQKEAWAWPQVPYSATEASERSANTTMETEGSSDASTCSWVCIGTLCACAALVLCVLCAVAVLLRRRVRKQKESQFSEKELQHPGGHYTSFTVDTEHIREGEERPSTIGVRSETTSNTKSRSYASIWNALHPESRRKFWGGKDSPSSLGQQSSKQSKQSSLNSCQNPMYTFQLNPGLGFGRRLDENDNGTQATRDGVTWSTNPAHVDNLDHVPEHPHQAPSYPPLPNAPNSTRDTPTEDSLLRNSLEHSMIVKKPSIIASVSSGASQRQLFPAEIHTTSDKPQGPYSTLYPTSNPTMDAAATAGGSPSGTAYNYAMRNFTSMESSARATADSEIRTVPEPFTVGIPSHGLETVPSQIDSPSPVAVQSRAMNVLRKENVASEESIKNLNQQLNCFKSKHRFLGQAVVQFARCPHDSREFAVKFFLDPSAFYGEAALYAAYFPALRKQLKNTPAAMHEHTTIVPSSEEDASMQPPRSGNDNAHISSTDSNANPSTATASSVTQRPLLSAHQMRKKSRIEGSRFLPHVEAICDSAEAGLVDPQKRPLPPCIVMERGESLQDWSDRAEPDRFASLWVLSNVASRMKDMHEAGYVHMDLKPANVILLPRENRWTVIDFGCSARINTHAPVAFSLTYCPPEVILAAESENRTVSVAPSMDVWALGVMAYELLSGTPAFHILTDGVPKVVAALRGDERLPWEGKLSAHISNKLGTFAKPVLAMLSRNPAERPSMHDVHACIVNMHGG